jgi:aminoglycoside phosphotransferase family enzyme/predicted kinase
MSMAQTIERNQGSDDSTSKAVLNLLRDPSSYPEPTAHVEQIDTHISSVFIADRFVYKLKKQVRFDFLDFSTMQKRREACTHELHLNRRLASDTYLAIVPITNENEGLRIGGDGVPVDWLVKMRRLPSHRSLDQLVQTQQLTKGEISALASTLATFFQRQPPLNINVDTYRRRIADHVSANDQALFRWAREKASDLAVVKRVHQAQRRLLELASDLLDARVCDGRIIDGHGDLRPEHIYFNPQPTIIDCIEFNAEFRQLDILDELAFLAIECEQLSVSWIGDEIIGHYQKASHDAFPSILLDFYKSYRACVRAKVLSLRADQVSTANRDELADSVSAYIQLAGKHALRLGPPALIVTYGLPGTGKSTLASNLARKLGIEVLRSDEIRHELFRNQVAAAEFDEGAYQPERRMAVYQEMFRRTDSLLASRVSVILDGTFAAATLRQQVVETARRHGAVPLFAHCQCPADVALERITSRMAQGKSRSDATAETYVRLSNRFEADPADLPVLRIDTTESGTDVSRDIFLELRKKLLA